MSFYSIFVLRGEDPRRRGVRGVVGNFWGEALQQSCSNVCPEDFLNKLSPKSLIKSPSKLNFP